MVLQGGARDGRGVGPGRARVRPGAVRVAGRQGGGEEAQGGVHGGGSHLCPGRNFASAEALGLVSALVVGYEVVGLRAGEFRAGGRELASAMPKPAADGDGGRCDDPEETGLGRGAVELCVLTPRGPDPEVQGSRSSGGRGEGGGGNREGVAPSFHVQVLVLAYQAGCALVPLVPLVPWK